LNPNHLSHPLDINQLHLVAMGTFLKTYNNNTFTFYAIWEMRLFLTKHSPAKKERKKDKKKFGEKLWQDYILGKEENLVHVSR